VAVAAVVVDAAARAAAASVAGASVACVDVAVRADVDQACLVTPAHHPSWARTQWAQRAARAAWAPPACQAVQVLSAELAAGAARVSMRSGPRA